MEEQIKHLSSELDSALKRLNFSELESRAVGLEDQMARPDFWQDSATAQSVSRQHAKLAKRLAPWRKLRQDVAELAELAELGDASLKKDLIVQLKGCRAKFEHLKDELKLAKPYDDYDAVMSIHAGAGGSDAQDWAGMLLRMYLRWAEKSGLNTKIIDESVGEEAGLKNVTLEIDGNYVYGKLKGERGVHRLVRLSPFNADNLRQTSFAKVELSPKIDQPAALELDEKDLKIDVYRSGGKGGQSVNTTDSAVRVTHLPTGISVAIQNERSQLQNKETALTILRSRLIQLQLEQHADKLSELKGENKQAAWGNQIRSYVLHPYKQVKDLRTKHETSDVEAVLGGNIDPFIAAYLEHSLGE